MSIPICPLMSAGNDVERLCALEKCAWYMKSYKTCSIYLLGHSAALEIKQQQVNATNKKS